VKPFKEAERKCSDEVNQVNVARPGFEPRQTVPKTVVLPLYYRAKSLKAWVKLGIE